MGIIEDFTGVDREDKTLVEVNFKRSSSRKIFKKFVWVHDFNSTGIQAYQNKVGVSIRESGIRVNRATFEEAMAYYAG